MKLYVNLAASNLSTALVKNETSNVPVRMPDLVLADTFTLEIYLTDGAGSFAEESGTSGNSIKVGIGIPGQPAVALQDTFSEITDGWSGEVDLATVPFSNLLDGAQSIAGYFEVELTTAEGRRTVAQVPVTLRNEIVAEDALAPEVLPDYYTADEADARFVAKAGDTMTGALQVASELSVKESAPLALALLTVRRSDDEIAVGIASDGSANFSGAVTVGITPTNAGHATRKDYVDAADAANAAAAATALAHADGAQVDADAAQFTADTALSNAAAAQATACIFEPVSPSSTS